MVGPHVGREGQLVQAGGAGERSHASAEGHKHLPAWARRVRARVGLARQKEVTVKVMLQPDRHEGAEGVRASAESEGLKQMR